LRIIALRIIALQIIALQIIALGSLRDSNLPCALKTIFPT